MITKRMPSLPRNKIPKTAKEVSRKGQDRVYDCLHEGKVVGRRWRNADGSLDMEVGLKEGRQHGYLLRWWENGTLLSAMPYQNGLEHGTARQWTPDGELSLTYKMQRGTGADLWGVPLAEERYFESGMLTGVERWWALDEQTVWRECYWKADQYHGIYREWNDHGRLRRGFPQYFVEGIKMTKRQYIAACKADPTLPPYCPKDNHPARTLPVEYVDQMKAKWGRHWRRNRRRLPTLG